MSINWDGTLENKKLDIDIQIRNLEKWQETLDILETKEVKDLVSIVDTIEKSLKPKEDKAPLQVNVLVQNLMEAKDDC